MKTLTSVEAQNRFGELLDAAQREPVAVTRRGRAVAVVLSPQDMDSLLDVRRKRSKAVADFEAWSNRARRSATAAAGRLTDQDVRRLVRESR